MKQPVPGLSKGFCENAKAPVAIFYKIVIID